MTTPKTALLLIGSAKPAGESRSEVLGTYLTQRLQARGITTTSMHLARALRTEERTQELLSAVETADSVVLAFPLYVDSLPYLVTRTLERIAANRPAGAGRPRPLFLTIVNCGFPESAHNDSAIAICQQFAEEAGFTWAGGLSLGEGGAIQSKPLAEAGGMVRNVVAALDQAAAALAEGKPAPAEAMARMAQPFIPKGMYVMMASLGWLSAARPNRTLTRLGERPFEAR